MLQPTIQAPDNIDIQNSQLLVEKGLRQWIIKVTFELNA